MKNIFAFLLIFCFKANYAQNYNTDYYNKNGIRIGSSQTKETPSLKYNYVHQYTPEMMQLEYEKNQRAAQDWEGVYSYRKYIMEWVLELKSKTTDDEFTNEINHTYQWLINMENEEYYGVLGGAGAFKGELDKAYLDTKSLILEYNKRVEQREALEKERAEKIETAEKERNDPNNRFNNGVEEFRNNNYESAIGIMDRLVIDGYKDAKIYFLRGSANFYLNRKTLALDDLKKADDLGIMDATLFNRLGWLYREIKQNEKSLNYFNKAVELKPNDAYNYYSRGELKANTNNNSGAIIDYNKAIELNPNFSMAYNNLGWAKFEMKLYKQALIDLNKAIELDDKNWNAYDSRQEVKFALNDLDGCLEDCNKAIAINPKVGNAYFFRGRVYFKKGDKKMAAEDWNQAGNLGKELGFEYIKKYCK